MILVTIIHIHNTYIHDSTLDNHTLLILIMILLIHSGLVVMSLIYIHLTSFPIFTQSLLPHPYIWLKSWNPGRRKGKGRGGRLISDRCEG